MNDDYLKSEEYKQKYEALMERCSKFMSEFAPPSPYELGFKAGWEAAKQEFHKDNKDNPYVPDTTDQAKTMDLQWPRDQHAWPIPRTTNPWPPKVYQVCSVCGMTFTGVMGYVCYYPNCPTKVTC